MKDITINTRQAVQKLQETNLILVLREVPDVHGLVKRYIPRNEAIELISSNVVEHTGEESMSRGFPMSLKDENGVVFVEGRTE